ncbi:MAG: histidine kinase [Lachnospiraceae bacterium]|nr:histidine kinase [Lachnospiraceae bacterium]
MFKKMHYKSKMILCYLIPVACLFFITAVPLYNSIVRPVRENAFQAIENMINQKITSVHSELEKIKNVSYTLSTNTVINNLYRPNYYSDLEVVELMNNEIYPLLSWISSSNPYMTDYHFFTSNTSLPATLFSHHYEDYQDASWMQSMKKEVLDKGFYLEPLHLQRSYESFSQDSEKSVYSLFYPLLYHSNFLEVELSPTIFFDGLSDQQVLTSGILLAVNQDGNIISGDIPDSIAASAEQTLGATFTRKNIPSGCYTVTLNKEKYYVCHQQMEELNTWIVCLVPYSDINTPLTETLLRFILLIFFITLGILLLSYLLATLLVKRINTIILSVRKIQNEDFDISLPVKGNDEVDQLASSINYMAGKINGLINQVYKAELLQKETELSALQAQINPHFLFNILDTFKMIAIINDLDDFSDSIAALGRLLRYNICPLSKQCLLSDEIKVLEDYIHIQNLLLNNRIHLLLSVPEELYSTPIPNFILQPLVENAFSHGFKDKLDTLYIKIGIFARQDYVEIRIEDNGTGISLEGREALLDTLSQVKATKKCSATGHGIGITNVYLRLLLQYQEQVTLDFTQSEELGGACIILMFPVYAE